MGSRASIVGLVGIGVVVVLFAFGLGRLTAPTEEAEAPREPPAPGATVDEVAVGEPLAWEEGSDLGEVWPIALLEWDASVYFFGTSAVPFGPASGQGTGLDAWVSADGAGWQSLGTVIAAPASVQSVVATPKGLVALGEADAGQVWMSTDATNWQVSELPPADSELPGSRTFLQTAGANDDVVVVVGSSFFDEEQLLIDALPEDLQPEGRLGYGLSTSSPPFRVTLHGPLGLALFTATGEELGLTDEQLQRLDFGGPEQDFSTVWSSPDGQTWTTSQLDTMVASDMTTRADGELVALGYGFAGSEWWVSRDGIEWVREGTAGEVNILDTWNDGVVGFEDHGFGSVLVYSLDGQTWESLGAEDVLPEALSWSYFPTSGGGGGFAAVAIGYDQFGMETGISFEEPEPIVLERDGYTLTVNEPRGTLELTKDGTEVLRLFLHTDQIHEEVAADLTSGTLTFLDPDTLEPLVTFTFEEIDEAQQASYALLTEVERAMEHRVFMFLDNDAQWRAHDLPDVVGSGAGIWDLLVLDDRVIAVVADDPMFGPGPPQVPLVHMWSAETP